MLSPLKKISFLSRQIISSILLSVSLKVSLVFPTNPIFRDLSLSFVSCCRRMIFWWVASGELHSVPIESCCRGHSPPCSPSSATSPRPVWYYQSYGVVLLIWTAIYVVRFHSVVDDSNKKIFGILQDPKNWNVWQQIMLNLGNMKLLVQNLVDKPVRKFSITTIFRLPFRKNNNMWFIKSLVIEIVQHEAYKLF